MKVSFLMFFISQWKDIKSCELEATPMGRATSKPASDVVCLLLLERRRFWLFQNYIKSDLMSNNMKMSDNLCN